MVILSLCDNVNVLLIFKIIKTIITLIKIVVPIILIFSLVTNYMTAIKSNDTDLLSKANKSAVPKIIAAILVFLIPTFVGILSDISSFNRVEFFKCINNSTTENINEIRIRDARAKIGMVKDDPTSNNYTQALIVVNKIKNNDDKKALLDELNNYRKYVDINNALNKLKSNKTKENRDKANELIEALSDSDPYKENFLAKFKEIGVGVPLNIAKGVQEFQHGGMTYFVDFPPDATTNMPILLWLHGDNCKEEWAKNSNIINTAYEAGYSVLIVHPYVGLEMGHSVKGWYEGGLLPTVKEIVDEVCDRYDCDRDNINIGGHSRGAIGTWMMVTKYPNFFHSAAPVSCCSFYGIKGESFKGMKVWAWRGSGAGTDYNNDDRYSCMQSDVNAVEPYAKEVRYTIMPGVTHGAATDKLQGSVEFAEFIFGD